MKHILKHIPNFLTLTRILLIPAIYFALGEDAYWLAVIFYICGGVSDFFDGWLARRLNVQSGFGRMLDPIADKLMVASVLLMLVEQDIVGGIHIIAALIILAREILVSGLREYLSGLRIGLPVSNLAKIKTTAQMVALGILIAAPAANQIWWGAELSGLILLWLAALLTIFTGYDYVRISIAHARQND